VKLGLIFPAIFLMGCGSGAESFEGTVPDAGVETGTHTPPSGLCCQITNNETDSAIWNSGRYSCLPDDAALQPFDPPWICNVSPKTGDCAQDSGYECLTCDQTACVTGMSCLGVNGTGIVLPCDQGETATPEAGTEGAIGCDCYSCPYGLGCPNAPGSHNQGRPGGHGIPYM
jgi:hypothetical protein